MFAINSSIPWFIDGEMEVFICRKDVAIAREEPRLLCVDIVSSACRILCVVCHGPLSTSKDSGAFAYWKDVAGWVAEHSVGKAVVFLGDANATVVPGDGDVVGDVGSIKANHASHDFMKFLMEAGIGCRRRSVTSRRRAFLHLSRSHMLLCIIQV